MNGHSRRIGKEQTEWNGVEKRQDLVTMLYEGGRDVVEGDMLGLLKDSVRYLY